MPDEPVSLSYPCYFALTERDAHERVQIDGFSCLCLFTDSDLVKAFHRRKYRTRGEQLPRVYTLEKAAELRTFLRRNEKRFAKENCRHVAIDPSPGLAPVYVTFRELMADLEWSD